MPPLMYLHKILESQWKKILEDADLEIRESVAPLCGPEQRLWALEFERLRASQSPSMTRMHELYYIGVRVALSALYKSSKKQWTHEDLDPLTFMRKEHIGMWSGTGTRGAALFELARAMYKMRKEQRFQLEFVSVDDITEVAPLFDWNTMVAPFVRDLETVNLLGIAGLNDTMLQRGVHFLATNCPKLEYLDMDRCSLTSWGLRTIMAFIEEHNKIRHIDLANNDFTDNDVKDFTTMVVKHRRLYMASIGADHNDASVLKAFVHAGHYALSAHLCMPHRPLTPAETVFVEQRHNDAYREWLAFASVKDLKADVYVHRRAADKRRRAAIKFFNWTGDLALHRIVLRMLIGA